MGSAQVVGIWGSQRGVGFVGMIGSMESWSTMPNAIKNDKEKRKEIRGMQAMSSKEDNRRLGWLGSAEKWGWPCEGLLSDTSAILDSLVLAIEYSVYS